MWRWIMAAAVGAMAASAVVVAQDHAVHGSEAAEAATAGYRAANAAMHHAMAIEFTGDPDMDFARAMIPHHEGAVAMAEVELQYGTDPELRKLAEEIIAAQQGEITVLQGWIKAHGGEE